MTEEMIQETKKEECKCFCKSEGFRNFVVVATGTFVGVFCAISLFASLHKPPKFIPMQPHMMQPPAIYQMHGCPIAGAKMYHHKKFHMVKPPHNFYGERPNHNFEGPRHHKNFDKKRLEHKFDGPRAYKDFEGKKPHPKFNGKKPTPEQIKKMKAILKKSY